MLKLMRTCKSTIFKSAKILLVNNSSPKVWAGLQIDRQTETYRKETESDRPSQTDPIGKDIYPS